MFKIFATRHIPEIGFEMLRKHPDVSLEIFPGDEIIPRRKLLKGVRGCNALLSLLTDHIDAEVMDAAGPQLKIISNYAVGFDNIDLPAAKSRGIMVTNTPGGLSDAVAEHAIGLLLAVTRRIPEADRFTKAGKYKGWGPLMFLGMELAGKTLGIIGVGRIGADVAERANKGLKMKVMYNDIAKNPALEQATGATFGTIEEVLAKSDVISIHVPLLESTHHLINADRLRLMKKSAYIINTSRGAVIDEAALVEALRTGVIAGAGIDVYEHEPKITRGLTKLNNAVLTPHIASATIEARDEMARLAAQAILDAMDGKTPEHLVK